MRRNRRNTQVTHLDFEGDENNDKKDRVAEGREGGELDAHVNYLDICSSP